MKQISNKIYEKVINNKSLIINFGHLSVFQIFNILIPVVTYPYLIKVLGSEKYGLLVFAQTIVAYLSIIVNFGFNLSATKEISIHRNNKFKLNEIVSSVFIIKGLLLLFSFALLCLFLNFNLQAKLHSTILLLSMYSCIFDMIFPVWYFQGIEKMKYVTLINVVSRSIFVLFIFILVKSENDYLLVPGIQGIGALIAGFFSLYIVFVKGGIKFSFQKFSVLKYHIKESYSLFISNIAIQIYTNANKLIVGSFLGFSEVAAYDLAEKLVSLAKTPLSLISQTIFPKISKEMNLIFVWKMARNVFVLNVFVLFILYFTAPILIKIMGGHLLSDSLVVLRFLAITVPVIGISNFLGIQILIPFGYNKSFSRVIVNSCIVYLFLFFIFYITGSLNIISITLMSVITEIYVTIHMYVICKQNKLLWKSLTI